MLARLYMDMNLEQLFSWGATVLMYATSSGRLDAINLLLLAGADHSITTLDDYSALELASTSNILILLRGVCSGQLFTV